MNGPVVLINPKKYNSDPDNETNLKCIFSICLHDKEYFKQNNHL